MPARAGRAGDESAPARRRGTTRTGAVSRSVRSSSWSQRRGRTARGRGLAVRGARRSNGVSSVWARSRPISRSRMAAQSAARVTSATVHRRPRTRTRLPDSRRSVRGSGGWDAVWSMPPGTATRMPGGRPPLRGGAVTCSAETVLRPECGVVSTTAATRFETARVADAARSSRTARSRKSRAQRIRVIRVVRGSVVIRAVRGSSPSRRRASRGGLGERRSRDDACRRSRRWASARGPARGECDSPADRSRRRRSAACAARRSGPAGRLPPPARRRWCAWPGRAHIDSGIRRSTPVGSS